MSRIARSALMMTTLVASLAITSPSPGVAATPDALAVSSGCGACHALDKKLMGPPYKAIAARYKGDAKAPAMLAGKVRSGGKGARGPAPMLPVDQKKIGDADLNAVIAWILKQ